MMVYVVPGPERILKTLAVIMYFGMGAPFMSLRRHSQALAPGAGEQSPTHEQVATLAIARSQ